MTQLMPLPLTVSCFSKIQIGFTFLVPADPGSPGQRTVKRVCSYNVTLLLNCVAQTNTNLLELELNDFETPVSRTVYLNSVANSVGFVAAAVSMPIGGCRARRSLVVDVDVSVATELTVL